MPEEDPRKLFELGDIVRIVDHLPEDTDPIDDMWDYQGKWVTIFGKAGCDGYYIEEDDGEYWWSYTAFEAPKYEPIDFAANSADLYA